MNRPYSHLELLDIEKDIYARYRLGDMKAIHIPCLHEYRVKKGGRKEQYINMQNNERVFMDDQTCSVCFKIRTNIGKEVPTLPDDDENLTRDKLERIDEFYKWLYRHDF